MSPLENLLTDFLHNNGSGSKTFDKVKLSETDTLDRLYTQYTNKQDIVRFNGVIEEIPPYIKKFNKRRLWFLNNHQDFGLEKDKVVAFQDGINVVVNRGEYIDAGEIFSSDYEDNPTLRNLIYLYKPDRLNLPSSKYYVYYYGDYVLNYSERQIIRFYFSTNPDKRKIQEFKKELTKQLNSRKIPFLFKLPLELENYDRSDTIVLYTSQNHYHYIKDIIIDVYDKFLPLFRDSLPLFVLELKTGLGVAEDPMGEESFGRNLCKVILETILNNDDCKTIEKLSERLKEKGYKTDELFRRPYTNYNYTLKTQPASPVRNELQCVGREDYSVYNDIALDYCLDLMEKALWNSEESFYWVTYERDAGSEYYKIIAEKDPDFDKIIWFLGKLTQLSQNRSFFPQTMLYYIEKYSADSSFSNEDFFGEDIQKFQTDVLNEYNRLLSSIFSKDEVENYLKHIKDKLYLKATGLKEIYYTKGETSGKVGVQGGNNIHAMRREYFNSEEVKELAYKIYQAYTDNQYPVKNEYNNYEYCPGLKGKLQIAMTMLAVYCPELLERSD